MRRALLPLIVLATACQPPKATCPAGFIGDSSQQPTGVVIYTDGLSPYKDLSDGPLPLEPPPQGGYVMYVGARVKNMDACGIEFAGRLLDSAGNEIGFDSRTTSLMIGADGYGHPGTDLSNVSNVNGCPQVSTKDIQGQPAKLILTVTDREKRTLTFTNNVVPTCNHADPNLQQHCICTCSANYFPGKCSLTGDAGSRD